MPAPKQNPALVAAAIATAVKVAKAAKAAKTVSSIAKKPVVKVQSNVKVVPQYKEAGGLNKKDYQTTVNNNRGIIVAQRKSGVAAEKAALRVTNNVKARKKPTIKITGK